MHDTSPEAQEVVLAAIRRRDPIERLRDTLRLSETMRSLALARLRQFHPEESTLELVERLTGESLHEAQVKCDKLQKLPRWRARP